MINLGMDFGSTYTMVSILENGEPRTVQSSHLMFHYPSIVCYDEDKNKYFYGTSARDRLGKKGIIGFRGFKMLLNEQMDPQMLRERSYSDKHTPEFITSFFLRSVLENTLKKLGEDKIGLLVIGAPECWFQSIRTIDARGTLRDICMGFKDIVERVELRSEPTDAAAFCVWNYEKKNKKQFDGSILVVDYGGGTLDTALVSVNHIEDKVQIKPEMLSGIGENSDREIGKAGIAYQEAVVRKAISEALGVPEAQINTNPSFDRAVKDLEDALITDCELIEDTFADYVATPSQLKDEILLKNATKEYKSVLQKPNTSVKRRELDRCSTTAKNAAYALAVVEDAIDRLDSIRSEQEWRDIMRDLTNGYKLVNAISTGSDLMTRFAFWLQKAKSEIKGDISVEAMEYYFGKPIDKLLEEQTGTEKAADMLVKNSLLDLDDEDELLEAIRWGSAFTVTPSEAADVAAQQSTYAGKRGEMPIFNETRDIKGVDDLDFSAINEDDMPTMF